MRRALVLALAVAAAAPFPSAHAQPAPDLVALGRQEYDVGQREFNLGHYEAALEHFEASYRLTARPALLYNIGVVYRQLFQRTRKLENLQLAIERLHSFLASLDKEPALQGARDRAQATLTEAEGELARETAARARGEENLTVGEQLLEKGRIADARAQLDRYLAATDNERDGVARAFLLDGAIALAEGKGDQAVRSYASALSLDRSRQLPPDAPEATKAAFAQAQERLGAAPPVGVLHTPPGALKVGAPIELRFAVGSDPQHLISGMRLFYRAGQGAFSSLPTQPVGKITLPAPFALALSPGARVDYYAEVVDARGAKLEHLGSPSLPFSTEIEKPRGPSLAKRPWFWGLLAVSAGAVAAGVGLGVYYTQPATYDVPARFGLTTRWP